MTYYGEKERVEQKEKSKKQGCALQEAPSTYVTIAIDTTGYNIVSDKITEISAVRFRNGREIAFLTKKIRDDISLIQTLEQFLSFIKKDVLVGHQVDLTLQFLSRDLQAFSRKRIRNDYVDTLYLIRKQISYIGQTSPIYYDEENYHTLAECYIANEVLCNARGTNIRHSDRIEYLIRSTQVRVKRKIDEKKSIVTRSKLFDQNRYKSNKEQVDSLQISIKHQVNSNHLRYDDKNNIDQNEHSLIGRECVFTGKLEHMLRGDAKQIVYRQGGLSSNTVTNHTDYLILGGRTYNGNTATKSTKYRKAERLQNEGGTIRIITEKEFLSMCDCAR